MKVVLFPNVCEVSTEGASSSLNGTIDFNWYSGENEWYTRHNERPLSHQESAAFKPGFIFSHVIRNVMLRTINHLLKKFNSSQEGIVRNVLSCHFHNCWQTHQTITKLKIFKNSPFSGEGKSDKPQVKLHPPG